jgi:hypothetical protein
MLAILWELATLPVRLWIDRANQRVNRSVARCRGRYATLLSQGLPVPLHVKLCHQRDLLWIQIAKMARRYPHRLGGPVDDSDDCEGCR